MTAPTSNPTPTPTSTPASTRSAPAARRTGNLQQTVLTHANKVHRLLSTNNHQDAADRLAAEARQWERDNTEVVVAGDIKRGKSSLVNALIDRPGLLPVDADVATAVHLVVRHGDPLTVTVTSIDPDSGESVQRRIEPEELPRYAALSGDKVVELGVTAVEVAVPDPLLERGLALVDTPGVGGMSRGHRDITMAALARADVLVFAVSATEPISRTEIEFLTEASERIGAVVIVATRCDTVSGDDLPDRLADIRARIKALASTVGTDDKGAGNRLRRLAAAPIVPTSSFIAEQATKRAARGAVERAAAMRTASGIPALVDRLTQAVDVKDFLRLANLLQLAEVLLEPRIKQLEAVLLASTGDESAMADLTAKRQQLEQAAGQQARWRGILANAFARLQTEAGREVGRELTVVRDHYRGILEGDQAQKLNADGLAAISAELGQSLTAAWSNLAGKVSERFDEIINELMTELSLEAETGLLGEFAVPISLTATGLPAGATKERFDALDDALPMATQTFMFSNIANALVGVLGLATGGIGLLAYGIGAAASAPIVLLRRRKRERRRMAGELLREINESLFGQEGIAKEFTTDLSLRIIDVRQELEVLIDTRLTQRRKELEIEHQKIQQLLKSELSTRRQVQQDTERVLAEFTAAMAATRALADQVRIGLQAKFAPGEPPP